MRRNAAALHVTHGFVVHWAVGCCGFLAACAPEQITTPPRAGQFGSLRDFVLFERPDERLPAFFLDRFEVTRADWGEFAASPAGRAVEADPAIARGDGSLPVARVDLRQARAFAAWRFSRLPRHDEWEFAAVGDGRHRYPWGNNDDRTRANTAELGLGESTPVGTFESGRRPGSDQPYDLVGNVSEWTESVPAAWWEGYPIYQELRRSHGTDRNLQAFQSNQLDPLASVSTLQHRVLRAPALAVWQETGGLVPLSCLVEAGGGQVPREVVGADFSTKMVQRVEAVLSSDRRDRTGFRVCATPRALLRALALQSHDVKEQDLEQLRRFVLRGRHRAVLGAVWPSVVEELGAIDAKAPVVRTLNELLATQDATNDGR